jgi:hypothetical protein
MWRPHYPFEHIAWVSPPWPCQDYLWFDFPEALFANGELYYLSHINPQYPPRFNNLPAIPWEREPQGITMKRVLPDSVRFSTRVTRRDDSSVDLGLFIENGSAVPLRDIRVQTCLYLRALREFGRFTNDNKLVHVRGAGWTTLREALDEKRGFEETSEPTAVRVGWRGGRRIADLPVIVSVAEDPPRQIAMTWFAQTFNLTGNAARPCMHADPYFADLAPGARATARGALLFHEGDRDMFLARLSDIVTKGGDAAEPAISHGTT